MAKRMTSRQFNQDTGGAKKAAQDGPVYITDRGKLAYVLLSFDDYTQLVDTGESILDLLSVPEGVGDIELDIPVAREIPRPVRFE